jgi:hypothetical protein
MVTKDTTEEYMIRSLSLALIKNSLPQSARRMEVLIRGDEPDTNKSDTGRPVDITLTVRAGTHPHIVMNHKVLSLKTSTPGEHAQRPAQQVEGVVPYGTNLGINGLASADRNNKATLPLTAPRCAIKSSAKDLSLRTVKLQYADKN